MSIDNEPKIEEINSSDEENDNPAMNAQMSGMKTLNRAEKKSRKAIAKMGLKPFCTGNKQTDSSTVNDSKNVPIPGTMQPSGKIVRVTVKKAKNVLFVLSQPDVWKACDNSAFVVFGEARVEDVSGHGNLMRQMMGKGAGGMPNPAMMAQMASQMGLDLGKLGGAAANAEAASAKEEPSSGSGTSETASSPKGGKPTETEKVTVDEADIDLVVNQVGCTREKAIAAMKANKNDIVEAIISLHKIMSLNM